MVWCVLHLLQMSQHIDPAIEDTLPLCRVQLVDELRGVVLVGFLIPV